MTTPQPGPELDRLVAEKVMGWTEGKDFYIHDYSYVNRKALALLKNGEFDGEWSPSTVISDAMEVLERFLTFELTKNDDEANYRYCCELYAPYAVPVAELAATAPHAICLAALAAVEKETPR